MAGASPSPRRGRSGVSRISFATVDEQLCKLSNRKAKITRDIQFAMNIGRDSPFDPFQQRDIQILLSNRFDSTRTLMYFPKEIRRKTPCLVDLARAPPGHDLNITTEVSTQADYDTVRPYRAKDVHFPKARRFDYHPPVPGSALDPAARTKAQLAGGMADAVAAMERIEESIDIASAAGSLQPPGSNSPDRSTADGGDAPSALTNPVRTYTTEHYHNAASFGRMSGRDGRAPTPGAPIPAGRAVTPGVPPRNTIIFPWERKSDKPTTAQQPAGGGTAGNDTVSRTETGSVVTHTAESNPALTAADEEAQAEAWQRKRKELITRFGLINDSSQDRFRRRQAPRTAADMRRTTSRQTPIFFAEHGKERNDVMYQPRFEVTTRERHTPSVMIEKYATRPSMSLRPAEEHMRTVNDSLKPTKLLQLHARLVDARKADVARGPMAAAMSSGTLDTSSQRRKDGGSNSSLSRTNIALDDEPVEETLTQADDVICHRESLYPPKTVYTRIFKKSPDIGLYANRSDETLASVLGGDLGAYRKQAMAAMASETL